MSGEPSKSRPVSARRNAGRLRVVRAAQALLEQVYVHLPLKRAMHAINPVQRLRLLEERCGGMDERAFHNEMLSIFLRLRDLHTNYILPEPLNRLTAYLPFRLQEYHERGTRHYVVTQLFEGDIPEVSFVPGIIVTHWNGIPVDRAVEINADREAGSNTAARHARGLESLTMRWLGMALPPDEDWVDITFHPPGRPKQLHSVRLVWIIVEVSADDLGVAAASGSKARAMGLDMRAEVERRVRGRLVPRGVKAQGIGAKLRAAPKRRGFLETETAMQDVFPRCGNLTTPNGEFGYIRIATFDVPDDESFVREFIRLTAPLSRRGLIIDVRGNGGGLVIAGERLLQCLTPRRIEPEKFHFINSRTTLQIAKLEEFAEWKSSIAQATQTGTEFSAGFPLLPAEQCNDIGQTYQGPVVLVTDALCYSTTDIFAAGFQDHEIGTIIGVSENTGAGGANVWDYALLRELLPGAQFPALPGGTEFRVAVRRTTRVHTRSGTPLEDLGVQPDVTYRMTRRDVLEGNGDLINFAARLLSKQPRHNLRATVHRTGRALRIRFTAENLDRVDVYLNDRPQASADVRRARQTHTLTLQITGTPRRGQFIELRGYLSQKLTVCTRAAV